MSTSSQNASEQLSQGDVLAVAQLQAAYERIRATLHEVIVGQEEVIEQLLIALFAGGHCILEGVPGLAKTLLISTLARGLDLSFARIQFTPDLMPSDITGTEIMQQDRTTGERSLRFVQGPVFTHVLLADEINRTPPKTQAALLECMQERQVTVGGQRHALEAPFFVLATQNPIEQEGTYPLPEAQQDRFMFKIFVRYPTYDEEFAIAERTTTTVQPTTQPVLNRSQILDLQQLIRRVPIAPNVINQALDLVRATRPAEPETISAANASERSASNRAATVRERSSAEPLAAGLTELHRLITWGAGPRAVQFLILAAKARAVLQGRYHVAVEDLRTLLKPVLRHRLVLNYSAEAEGYTPDRLIERILEIIPPHSSVITRDGQLRQVLSS
ncbi:MAG: hypothetical protein HJJLKODD_01039 [Phycisphaerae bacterium]|nr:hypothetical protein [Phycisphaerae bacterium]